VVLLGLLVCVVAVCATAVNWEAQFNNYVKNFHKKYANQAEVNFRLANYRASMTEAGRLNALNPHAQFGATKFSDLTKEEFNTYYKGAKPPSKGKRDSFPVHNMTLSLKPHPIFERDNIPRVDANNWDWCQAGVITPVNNQGGCGSCWAFSAMETIESYHCLHGSALTALSAEQITACDVGNGDYGCGGGWPMYAYEYVNRAGGIETAAEYPYTYGNGGCLFNGQVVTTVVGAANIPNGEAGLYAQLSAAGGGPVSVCVAADTWQNYQGGILTTCDTYTDHCVQLTGYQNWNSAPVWRVRNQWGTDWGEGGYIFIAVGGNLCNIGDYGTIVATND